MAPKTDFSESDISRVLSDYDLGSLTRFGPFATGAVQTNLWIETTKGKFVFRYYENRPREAALSEASLLRHLTGAGYPCPAPIRNIRGGYVGTHRAKPYTIFTFLEGEHLAQLDRAQTKQLASKTAELHVITQGYRPAHTAARLNYSVPFCREQAEMRAKRIGTPAAAVKLEWLNDELDNLVLPRSLPKGICHCDFHPSNLLFRSGRLVALLDFDDANYTFLTFDLVNLVDYWLWPPDGELDFAEAREVLRQYEKHRKLNASERKHLYDVYKLQILVDCLWFFERGGAADFREKRKVDYLNSIGRDGFSGRMFS